MNEHYDERLHFSGGEAHFDPYVSAQHVVRYACVRDFVKGARVLDVACGEGYGAKLMCDWGACEVVGVDISPEAIARAQEIFGAAARTFVVGDVEQLDRLEGVDGLFDVIVSFETIEHIDDPARFLRALRSRLADGGGVAISCPNEEGLLDEGKSNPFHVRRLDFQSFRALTEAELGQPSGWLLGSPISGEMNLSMSLLRHCAGADDALALVAASPFENALLLPASASHAVSVENCTHFVGIWGREVKANAVVSAQSYESFFEAWRANDWLKDQLTYARAEHENNVQAQAEACRNEIAALRDECAKQIKILRKDQELKMNAQREDYESRIGTLNLAALNETEALRQKILGLSDELTHWQREAQLFEREANRLRPFELECIALHQRIAGLEVFRLSVERSRLFRLIKLYARVIHHQRFGKPFRLARRVMRNLLGR